MCFLMEATAGRFIMSLEKNLGAFPGGSVVQTSSSNAEDAGLILDWGARIL